MELWKSLGGMLRLRLISAEPENTLQTAMEAKMDIFDLVQENELSRSFSIRRSDYETIKKICEKRGETLQIVKKTGLYWTGRRLLARPVLLMGMAVCLFLIFYLPGRVLFVEVDGNQTVPQRQILAAAEECGIRFGASRRAVRSEQMKNALLSAIPQLQWAGVNTKGCVAVISVRERSDPEQTPEAKGVGSLEAIRDGYILSMTALRGTPLVQPGQTVRKGQILISGYTDCGICIQATRAEGEIFAQTKRQLTAVTPQNWQVVSEIREEKKKYSLLLGKNRINLWKDSGISGGSCGRMYEEYYVTLPGELSLPVAFCVDTFLFQKMQEEPCSEEEAGSLLKTFGETALLRQMNAGQILQSRMQLTSGDGVYRLEGNYVCTEMIGRLRQEQIGDTNGKIN